MEACRKSPSGYSGDPSPTLLPQTVAHNHQSKLASQILDKQCEIQHTIALTNSTITDPLGTPLPQKGIVIPSISCVVGFPRLCVVFRVFSTSASVKVILKLAPTT